MSAHPPIIEAEDAILGRLAALDMQAAEHVHGCLLGTTTPGEVAELSLHPLPQALALAASPQMTIDGTPRPSSATPWAIRSRTRRPSR